MRGAVALVVVLCCTVVAAGCGGSQSGSRKDAELKAATKAFTDRGVKFSVTFGPDKWRALQPALTNIGSDIPADLRAHTVGYALSFPFSRLRAVYVFDSSSSATRFAEVFRKRRMPAGVGFLVARDVVYFGLDDKVAHEAMASLAHEAVSRPGR